MSALTKTVSKRLADAALPAIAAGLMVPTVAAAQGTAEDVAAQSAAEEDTGGLNEIIVTAQHRAENLRDVPIAINAITADSLKEMGVSDTSTLVQAVPSLNFTRSGPSGIFVIRGVSTPNGASGEEGSTAVYVDDIYMPDLFSTINTFNNIERIEVLNGPQGTLFGRNATGGLIRVITREPGDRAEVSGQIGYANYNTVSGQLYASTPISEQIGINVALTGQEQGKGFGYNPTLGRDVRQNDYWGVRGKLVARPTETLKITLGGEYFWTHDSTAVYLWAPETTGIPVSQDSKAGYPSLTRINVWGVNAKAELELGGVDLTSITAYRHLQNQSAFDVDARAADVLHLFYDTHTKSFQQELRVASNGNDRLKWQLGAFYLHLVNTVDQYQEGLALVAQGFDQTHIVARGVTDSISVFGEVTYDITPRLHVTGGLRWTSDTRKLPIGFTDVIKAGAVLVHRTNPLNSVTYSNLTYRAALRYDVNDTANVYATINKGFKSGQFNLQTPQDAPVRPQTIMAYEVGAKADLFDRRLRVSLAGYHYNINDYQIRSVIPGTGTSALRNAAKVRIDGVDVNLEAAVTDRLRVTAGATWLDARFSSFPSAPTGNATGNQTAAAPHFNFTLGGSYTLPLGGESELRLAANYVHKSSHFFETNNVLRQPAYDVVNASIEYRLNEHAALELYMKNIGDELYNVQMTTSTNVTNLAGAPRQYGANFKFDF